jgi:putative membrane protein
MKTMLQMTVSLKRRNVACGVRAMMVLAGLLLSWIPPGEGQGGEGPWSAADYDFASRASTSGAFQVVAGRLATQKATRPAVKQFGQLIVADHGKVAPKLNDLAARSGVSLPGQPTTRQQQDLDRLKALAGTEFDKEYLRLMGEARRTDLQEFQSAATTAGHTELRLFAAQTIPTIEHHLKQLKNLEGHVRGTVSVPGSQP